MKCFEKSDQPKLFTLRAEHDESAFPFLVYLATPIIWLSFFKDIAVVGFKWDWLLIRLCYLPYIWLVFRLTASLNKRTSRFYELPLWGGTLYITAFCTYFSSQTGYLASKTTLGLMLLYFGAAVLPVTPFTFIGVTTLSVLSFVGGSVALGGWHVLNDGVAVSNLVPLVLFSYIVFGIIHRNRSGKLQSQKQLADVVSEQSEKIQKQSKQLAEVEIQASLGRIASQVAHDIRGPMATIDAILLDATGISENDRQIASRMLKRVNQIADDLLLKKDEKKVSQELHTDNECKIEGLLPEQISSHLKDVLTEKKTQYRSHEGVTYSLDIESDEGLAFSSMNSREFKRILSNLIDNAVEAVRGRGEVHLSLRTEGAWQVLAISDSGVGIPEELLSRVTELGFTYGKERGSGLGLHHAKTSIEAWGGRIEISSRLGQGTTVRLYLKTCEAPSWYIPEIRLSPEHSVVVLDDDPTVIDTWKMRFRSLPFADKIRPVEGFTTRAGLLGWAKANAKNLDRTIFLCDFELRGQNHTGLDVIEETGLERVSFLVTGAHDDPKVRKLACQAGIKVLPKCQIATVPVEFSV